MATCSSCQAETRWAKFRESGKFVMLDPEPVPGGNLAMKAGTRYHDGIPRVWVVTKAELAAQPVQLAFDADADRPLMWRAHFASCPFSNQHRRTR